MGPSEKTFPTRLQGLLGFVRQSGWLLLAVTALFFIAQTIRPAPCWMLFMLVSLVGWPVWRYRIEYLLFRRRLVLEGAMQSTSWPRRWLWKGTLIRVFQAVISILLAWLLLMLVSRLAWQHWLVLAGDAVLLVLLQLPVTRWFSSAVQTRHLGVVVRRWPLFLINGIALTLVFLWLDFAVVGVPDTRHMAWNILAEQTWDAVYGGAGCVLWGMSAAAVAVLEALAWHLSQRVIPGLPDTGTQLIAWGFFLLRGATVAWLFTAMLLGVSTMLERRAGKTGNTLVTAFLVTIILLALPFFYAAYVIQHRLPTVIEEPVAESADPCEQDTARRDALRARLDSDIEAQRQQAAQAIDAEIEQELDVLFADVEQGVDHYLDWYFTVMGEYERLAAVITDGAEEAMREQLQQHLFADTGFDDRLGQLDADLEALATGLFVRLAPQLRQGLADTGCAIGPLSLAPLSELDHDALRASVAATSGVGAGIIASKTAAAVMGKVAAKKSIQTGTALATKTLAKKGSSTLLSAGAGTALCAPTGPVAILCGVTAGLVTWFTVDKVMVEVDEALNRDEMRAAILQILDEQKVLLGEQLARKHRARIDLMAARVDAAVERTFVPADEGMGAGDGTQATPE